MSTELPSDDDYMEKWEEWIAVENGYGPRATWDPLNICDNTTGQAMNSLAIAYAMPTEYNTCSPEDFTKNLKEHHIPFPSMPCINSVSNHREKIQFEGRPGTLNNYRRLFNAALSRPVSRAEMLSNPRARASMRNEWSVGMYNERHLEREAQELQDSLHQLHCESCRSPDSNYKRGILL